MRQGKPTSGERIVEDIKRQTRKQYSAEEKIRIVLDGLRGEESIAELCRKEGIAKITEERLHVFVFVRHRPHFDLGGHARWSDDINLKLGA